MNQKSPFKFLDAYNEQDHDIFFGRDQETEALYDALSGVKHLLVYGPSGAGKTSLIECGLRNQFSDADWYALTIRRGADLNQSVLVAIRESLDDASELPDDTPFGKAIERLFAERFQPVYLLFDQFEELLISAESEEKKTFFKNLNDLIQYKVPCRVLLIMREEFVGHLSEYEKECPSIFQHRFRLEKMGRANVRAVILNTLKADQYRDDFSVAKPDALTEEILSKLPDNQRVIELAHVQVFLNELWERAHQNQSDTTLPQLRADLVNDKDSLQTVLDEFLKKQIDTLDQTYGEHNTLYTLAAMISERDTKLQVSQAEIEEALRQNEVTLPNLNQLLDTLAKRRIIRTLKSGGQIKYEISHDILAEIIGDNRTDEMKQRSKARNMYDLFEQRTELLAQQEINMLYGYEWVLPFPDSLNQLIKNSEVAIEKKNKEEVQKAQEQLKQERERAEKEKDFAKKQKRLRIGANIISAAAGVLLLITFIQYSKVNSAKNEFQNTAIIATTDIQKIRDALNFDKNELVLVYNGDHYGFINEKGELLINYKYEEATAFDSRGYAKVKRGDTDYLIDKKGIEYHWPKKEVSGNRNNTDIEVFDFSEHYKFGKKELWQQVLENTQLKVLLLNRCSIKMLPTEIGQLKELQELNLRGNQLSVLPAEIGQLEELQQLNLRSNGLNTLPAEVGQLKKLQYLNVIFNDLNSLPIEIGQLKKLQKLELWKNELTILPSEIGELKELRELDLNCNQLEVLPAEIRGLKELQYLNLRGNQLTTLPAEIGELRELQTLFLNHNQLGVIPAEIGQLKKLQKLDLRFNQLNTLPAEIGQLKELQYLNLMNNELSDEEKQKIKKLLPNCEIEF